MNSESPLEIRPNNTSFGLPFIGFGNAPLVAPEIKLCKLNDGNKFCSGSFRSGSGFIEKKGLRRGARERGIGAGGVVGSGVTVTSGVVNESEKKLSSVGQRLRTVLITT